ncbi:MAG TPA: hypothetical protein VFX38_01855, partial [Gammaproteobacteria bacterium]|nr:hypothetical protein [Gammaproteobacteria bacterium]
LAAAASTIVTEAGVCPDGYAEYDGTLAPGEHVLSPPYQAPAGQENAILTAPSGFQLFALWKAAGSPWAAYPIPANEVHRWGPAGSYGWVVKALPTSGGGDYTLCIQHPQFGT